MYTPGACHDCNNITQYMCHMFKPKRESIKAISEITNIGFRIKCANNYFSLIFLKNLFLLEFALFFTRLLSKILSIHCVFNPIHEIASNINRTTKMVLVMTLEYLMSFLWWFSSKVDVASNSRVIIVNRGTESLSCDCIFFMDEKWMSKKALTYGCLQSGSKVSSVASL